VELNGRRNKTLANTSSKIDRNEYTMDWEEWEGMRGERRDSVVLEEDEVP
jgi:hypothetical protein